VQLQQSRKVTRGFQKAPSENPVQIPMFQIHIVSLVHRLLRLEVLLIAGIEDIVLLVSQETRLSVRIV